MVDNLHKMLNKFKGTLHTNLDNVYLNLYDITLNECIPNSEIFQINISKTDTTYQRDLDKIIYIDPISKNSTKILVESQYKIKTNEKFYKNGIIENTFFNHINDDINYTDIKLFSTKICDYNWLLSFNIFLYYTTETNSKLDFVKTKNIRLLNIGNGDGGFISGLYYYLYISYKSNTDHNLKQYDLKWFGIDVNNNISDSHFLRLSKLLDKLDPNSYQIIHGLINDDITDCKNLMYIKTLIENKVNDINVLYNNVKPRGTKNNIMLSIIILSIYSLNLGGIMITKILEPEFWDGNFSNYLILASLLFKQTKIFRFPICKNHKTYYRYYLVGYHRKHILYNSIVGMRLIHILSNCKLNQKLPLTNTIGNADEINIWKQKIQDIKNTFTSIIFNPITELQKNIDNLQKII